MILRTRYEDMPSAEIVRRVEQIARHSCTSLYTPPVCHDPIFTPLFTSLFTSIGFSAGAASFAASVATAITTTALTIGLQMLMAPKPPKPEALKVPLAQPIPYRIWAVGRTRLAGAYMLWESKGHRLFAVQAIAGHRIKSFNRYWLHDDEVTINGSGFVASPGGGRYANNSVKIQSRLGLPTETPYADAVSEFSSEGLWTNDHRGDGQASVCLFAGATRQKDQNKRFPYGVPQLSVEIDGALCWDFRDPAQDPANPATWLWTRNSAVICVWHLCFNEFGFGLDYQRAILPVIDLWKEEADICDEDVPLAGGGTEKRYECNGTDTTENGPKAGLNAILATCDGHLVSRGDGARILTVGKFRESRCATLTDGDIVGHNVQYGELFEDEINRLIPKFTYPATDYSTSDTDYFEDTTAQLEAGRVLADEAEYQWVHQWRQARRLGKRDWLRLREKVRGSIDVRLSGINSVYARWVRLETPKRLPSLNGKLVENRRSILALSKAAGFTMDIVGHPDNIDTWTPATDEGAQPPVPTAPNASTIPTPVINLVQAKADGGTVYIRVVVIDPADGSLTPLVRYRVADIDGLGTPGAWVQQSFPDANPSGGYISMNTNPVPANQLLEVEAAFQTSGGAFSDWSPTEEVMSVVGAYDSATVAIIAAMAPAPNATRSDIIDTAVRSLKTAGLWTKAEHLWFEAAHSEQPGTVDWKVPTGAKLTKAGTIAHAIDRGFKGDGATGRVATGFNPGDGGSHIFVQNSNAVAVWVLEDIANGNGDIGNTTHVINAHGATNEVRLRSSANTTDTIAAVGTSGFFATSRTGSANFKAYVNTTAPVTITRTSEALASFEAWLCGWNSASPQYSPRRNAFAGFFSGLTDAEVSDLREIVRAYLSAIGAI